MHRILFIIFFLPHISVYGQLFDSTKVPDYSKADNWAALPWRQDAADSLPDSTLKDSQDSAQADVFFIHPTTHLTVPWNQSTEGKIINSITDKISIQQQASIFNGSCKVYAPRYRQATFFSMLMKSSKADSALDIAYSDISRAFEYYLKNYNKGRPIVIAAHSQGSKHGVRLLKEFFDGKKLSDQLVVAYLPGWVVKCDEFGKIPLCDSAPSTGCFVSWNSFFWGADILNDMTQDACCVNPISWRADTVHVPTDEHKGSVSLTFNTIDENAVDSKCKNGKLWVHLPSDARYWLAGPNYHVLDYHLFYLDIRENVKVRIENFRQQSRMDRYR